MGKTVTDDQAAVAAGQDQAAAPVLDLAALTADVEAPANETVSVSVPQEVKDFVDRAHTFWQDSPSKWRKITLRSEAAVKELKKAAGKWAKATGRTFRENKNHDLGSSTLMFKVTDAIRGNGGSDASAETAATTQDG